MPLPKGNIPWNRGLKTGYFSGGGFKKGNIPWNKGIKAPYRIWNTGLTSREDSRILAGPRNGRYKGYRTTSNGYVVLFKPDHPDADKRGRVYEHRLIMEQFLGRLLMANEEVHHVNGIKNDNCIENLTLETTGTHRLTHTETINEIRKLKTENFQLKVFLAAILCYTKSKEH